MKSSKGGVRQAAERLWDAATLAVKAYALWREGKRLSSHGDLWEYKRRMKKEIGRWVYDAWNAGQAMRTCFYEGWCTKKRAEEEVKRIEKLVTEVERRVTAREAGTTRHR